MSKKSLCRLLIVVGAGLIGIISSLGMNQSGEAQPLSSPYVPEGYELVFSDEFEAEGLNPDNWQHRYYDGHEYGAGFASHESVVQPGDGYLHLATRFANGQFLTGMVQSVPQFRYGYFEARIRFQRQQGHHGAFWL